MKFKNKELFLGVLLGTGLNLLNSLRERLPDNLDDIKDRVRDTYGTASERVRRARGDETRADIAEKVSDFGDKVRERAGKKPQSATGTHGE